MAFLLKDTHGNVIYSGRQNVQQIHQLSITDKISPRGKNYIYT